MFKLVTRLKKNTETTTQKQPWNVLAVSRMSNTVLFLFYFNCSTTIKDDCLLQQVYKLCFVSFALRRRRT